MGTKEWLLEVLLDSDLELHTDEQCSACEFLYAKYGMPSKVDPLPVCKLKLLRDLVVISQPNEEISNSSLKEKLQNNSTITQIPSASIGLRSIFEAEISKQNVWPLSFKQGPIREILISQSEFKALNRAVAILIAKLEGKEYDINK